MKPAAILACILSSACCLTASAQQPNIVVILCDDLGYSDLENYGHPHIRTPPAQANSPPRASSSATFIPPHPVCSPPPGSVC